VKESPGRPIHIIDRDVFQRSIKVALQERHNIALPLRPWLHARIPMAADAFGRAAMHHLTIRLSRIAKLHLQH
jgi:hypothetical protein